MTNRRGKLPALPETLGAYIGSFRLTLQIGERSANTIRIYTDAASWFGRWLTANTDASKWTDVTRDHLRSFFLHMQEVGYEQGYRNNIGRALQAFFKWFAEEEDVGNPYAVFKPPPPRKLGEKVPAVIAEEHLRALIKDAESGRDFESRRDAALLRMFACTGCRLSEIAGLDIDDVSVPNRTALVTGKGGRQRIIRFDAKCALALDRYLRRRAEHRAHQLPALWIGTGRHQRMTPSGIRQVVRRRGRRLGLRLHPHMFRHTFSHNWLDEGGAEGDLMELNGWESPQMLRHYGASARGARARRAYDRVNVMRDI